MFTMKMPIRAPLSKSQILSVVAGVLGWVVANWTDVSQWLHVQLATRHWFLTHPAVKESVVAVMFIITMYCRSLHPKLSGLNKTGP
jgi:hypothetical protein